MDSIQAKVENFVATITFNRPRVMNAFNVELIAAVRDKMAEFSQRDDVRVIIVNGEGRCFSAGFDMKESATREISGAEQWREVLQLDFDFIMDFWHSPKPTIAAVHGYCLGGAFELMLAADLSVASVDASFGMPEPKFGSTMLTMLAPSITGAKQVKELLLTGADKLSAQRVLEMGLLNYVVAENEVLGKAQALAQQIVSCAPMAVQKTKQAINHSYENAGLEASQMNALDTAIGVEVNGGPEKIEFNRIRKESGLQAALQWRDRSSVTRAQY